MGALEAGRLPKKVARNLERTARLELLRLFDEPKADLAFRQDVAAELKSRWAGSSVEIEKTEQPLELTLRGRGRRQAAALRVLIHDPATGAQLRLAAIERLGKLGDASAIPAIGDFLRLGL